MRSLTIVKGSEEYPMSAIVKIVHGRCHSIIASTFGKEKKIFICNPQRPSPMLPGLPPKFDAAALESNI